MVYIEINIGPRMSYDEVIQQVEMFPMYLNDNISRDLMSNVAPILVEEAKFLCPVKTGLLQSSIHAEPSLEGIEIVADVEYARFIEFGTIYIRPYNFILYPIDMHYSDISTCIEQTIRDFWKAAEEGTGGII